MKVFGTENIGIKLYVPIGWGIPIIVSIFSVGIGHRGYGTELRYVQNKKKKETNE